MKIQKKSKNEFIINLDSHTITLDRSQYEDLYYCLPLDPSPLFMLLNDTILNTNEQREKLNSYVESQGDVVSAMSTLSDAVQELQPDQSVTEEEIDTENAASRSTEDDSRNDSEKIDIEYGQSEGDREDPIEEGEEEIDIEPFEDEEFDDEFDVVPIDEEPEPLEEEDSMSEPPSTEEPPPAESENQSESAAGPIKPLENFDGMPVLRLNQQENGHYVLSYENKALEFPEEILFLLNKKLDATIPTFIQHLMHDVMQSDSSREMFREMMSDVGGITRGVNKLKELIKEHNL